MSHMIQEILITKSYKRLIAETSEIRGTGLLSYLTVQLYDLWALL